MDINCPRCGTSYELDESYIGRKAKCEVCGSKFIIEARHNSATETPTKKVPRHTRKTAVVVDYVGNRLYFSEANTQAAEDSRRARGLTIWFLSTGGLLAGSGFICASAIKIGIVFAVVSIVAMIVNAFRKKPWYKSNQEIDAQARAMGDGIEDKAMNKLGIVPEEVSMIEPLRFWGYRFVKPSVLGDVYDNVALWMIGKDRKWRSSEVSHTILYFGEHSVYCYVRTTSLVCGNVSQERTEEYFYRDIVSVKTDLKEMKMGSSNVKCYVFIVVNTGGERLEIDVEDQSEAEMAVRAFRALLKQKKF